MAWKVSVEPVCRFAPLVRHDPIYAHSPVRFVLVLKPHIEVSVEYREEDCVWALTLAHIAVFRCDRT